MQIVKCFECKKEFEVTENEIKKDRKFFCSCECAIYAGYFSVTKGWRRTLEEPFPNKNME